MFSRRAYSTSEIRPGLALFVSPSELRQAVTEGAGNSAFLPLAGLDNHYVLVLDVMKDWAAVTPLTSHPNSGAWKMIGGKRGHPGWVVTPTYFDPSQLWPVPVEG